MFVGSHFRLITATLGVLVCFSGSLILGAGWSTALGILLIVLGGVVVVRSLPRREPVESRSR